MGEDPDYPGAFQLPHIVKAVLDVKIPFIKDSKHIFPHILTSVKRR